MDKPPLVLAVAKQLWAEKRTALACGALETLVAQLDMDKVNTFFSIFLRWDRELISEMLTNFKLFIG